MCTSLWAAGIASLVQRQSGAGRVVKRGYPVNFCYTYSPSTPFRSVRAAMPSHFLNMASISGRCDV